ncbi:unnamed protein product [Penicillium discolor]
MVMALALSVVFFAASQSITGRDWIVLSIGALVGGAASAFVATFVFHSDRRRRSNAAAVREASAIAELARRHSQKRTELLALIPTREMRLEELHEEILQLRIEVSNSQGYEAVGHAKARDAAQHGFVDIALENQTNAQSWKLHAEARSAALVRKEQEVTRLQSLTDEDWSREQAERRLLDVDNNSHSAEAVS